MKDDNNNNNNDNIASKRESEWVWERVREKEKR